MEIPMAVIILKVYLKMPSFSSLSGKHVCYEPKDCVHPPPPKFICCSSNPQCDNVWIWDLWKMIRSWRWSPLSRICALKIKDIRELISLGHVNILSDMSFVNILSGMSFVNILSGMSFVNFFLPVLGLSFHSLDSVFHKAEVFNFNEVQLINSFIQRSRLWCCIYKVITKPKLSRF